MDQTLSRSRSSESIVSMPKRVNEVFDKKVGAKVLLARLGSVSSLRLVYNLNGAFNYLHVGWWL